MSDEKMTPKAESKACPSVAQITPGALTHCTLPAGHAGSHVGHNGRWVSANDAKTA